MPTNANAYNSRVTDEALEKRFRDTFRSQGGAELVDDLYASGVIIPVVDFTQAAEGSQLPQNLQTAWDFSTGFTETADTTSTLISTAGFWLIRSSVVFNASGAFDLRAAIAITDGLTSKPIFSVDENTGDAAVYSAFPFESIVFVRSGDSVTQTTNNASVTISSTYRQIATISGDLVNPTGFTSS